MKSIWQTLTGLFEVLPKGARTYYFWYAVVTALLAILDAVALGLIVLVVTPLATGNPIVLPVLGEVPESATIWIIVTICGLFILKGVFAVVLHWNATRKFARYELEVGDVLFSRYLHSSWEKRSRMSTAEVTRVIDGSMAHANRGFILPLSQIPGNALTFISVLAVLVIAQPVTALTAFAYLTLISGVMLFVVSRKARLAGTHNRQYSYRIATVMTEMVDALKEVTLRNKLDEIGKVISSNRKIATRARANIAFMNIVPKYAFEAALIGGFLLIGAVSYMIGGATEAIIAVSLFAATGFRMIPAMNAVQSSFTSASASEVYAGDVIRELKQPVDGQATTELRDTAELPETPSEIEFRDVSFRYPGSDADVLTRISFSIPMGTSLAIVGPSGAGKSTLIDLLLGLSVPTTGSIFIDGVPLAAVLAQWRKRVGYVPQRVALFDASLAQNVALTWEQNYDSDRVVRALHQAHLGEFLDRPLGIQARIGERGDSVSGGQQQRLGIARALYSDPFVMVMDEATSSLDTATENRVTESMNELLGSVTFVTVAHRLATIREYDQVCYLDQGRILGRGSFDEVMSQVPDFRSQARLAGLT